MSCSARFGYELNVVQSSEFIKNLVDKKYTEHNQILKNRITSNGCSLMDGLWIWGTDHWVKAGKQGTWRESKRFPYIQALSGRPTAVPPAMWGAAGPEVVTCREAETENAGMDLVGRASVEVAAAGHTWLRCCRQRQRLSAVAPLFRLRVRERVPSHLPIDG